MTYVLGTDVGGTFTDFLLVDEVSGEHVIHKSPSTPQDPSLGLMNGLYEIAGRLEIGIQDLLSDTSLVVHGTTVATNAVLTGQGSKTGLLTTEGFRDILEMRRGVRSRRHLYDNTYSAPLPLVSRERRVPVQERMDYAGNVIEPLDDSNLEHAISRLRDENVESVAICFMHSYANAAHEREAKKAVEDNMPGVFVTASVDVLPQMRLFERVSTSVMNSYVGPVVQSYMSNLVSELKANGFDGALLVMQSNGGVATPDTTANLPATIVLSGPAAGPVAGLEHVRPRGSEDCIVVDMGGTSFDASLVKDGVVQLSQDGEINRQKIALPTTHIHTIGAGGGSIGWIDSGGLLRVGPQSAGAEPGPVAYGRGGTEPTVTDADLVLGYLNPEYFLGGRMRLDADLAQRVIEETLARPLGVDVIEAAAGMYEVVNLAMAAGTKDISVQRGYDPREFALVVAGGAGPIHAGPIARELGMDTVVLPRLSSVLCASGMLLADLRHDYVRSFVVGWSDLDADEALKVLEEMQSEGAEALRGEGVAPDQQDTVAAADMRYVGQHHEVTVRFGMDDLQGAEGPDNVLKAFHAKHDQLYGFSTPGAEVQVLSLRAACFGRRKKLDLTSLIGDRTISDEAKKGRRPVYVPSQKKLVPVDIYDGDVIGVDQVVEGPAVVEEETTTVFVPEGFRLSLESGGSFVMQSEA